MKPLIVSGAQASKMMAMRPQELYKLLEDETIRAYKDHGNWKVPVSELEKYIEKRLEDENVWDR